MKRKYLWMLWAGLVVSAGCLRLDSNLYNASGIEAYQLDDYQGEVIFRLPDQYDIPADKIHLFTLQSGGYTIWAVYVGDTNRIAADTVILYCHGNRDHLDHYWERIKLLANAGGKLRYGVLSFDYRGFGLSEGTPTEEGMNEDADAAVQWLKQRGLTADRLVIYGYSLGSAPATELTAHPRTLKPAKLILESPFASAAVMVQDAALLAMPPTFFTNLKLNNADKIREVDVPFCWIHGQEDKFLSDSTHGRVIYERYQGPYKEAHVIPGAVHNNVPQVWGYDAYMAAVAAFIQR